MAVTLTKPMPKSAPMLEEIYPQKAVQEIYPQQQTATPPLRVEVAPAAQPLVTVEPKNCKKAVVHRLVGNKCVDKVENIPLNDLTALSDDELKALTHQSIKEIESAFALIQRVAAEGERRAELDTYGWSDSAFTDVCDFHKGVVQKIIAYNKRHKKLHPIVYRKELDEGGIALIGGITSVVLGGIAFLLHFLGLY